MAVSSGFFSRLSLRFAGRGSYPTSTDVADRAARIEAAALKLGVPATARPVLHQLEALGVSPVDLWHGSHVILRGDNGRMYEQWARLGVPRIRSSHYPDVDAQQFDLSLGANGTLLFGKTANNDTWLQLERHAFRGWRHPLNFAQHSEDFLEYEATRQNVGPLGRSPHTERRAPVVIDFPWLPAGSR